MSLRYVTSCALLVLLLSALPCFATYGGLVMIPTADVVGDGGYSIEWQIDGDLSELSTETRFLNTQFGIGDRFEAGIDFDFSSGADNDVLLNAKYVFGELGEGNVLLATGVHSVERDSKSVAYLVATGHYNGSRVHLGGHRRNGGNHWFAGIDRAISDRWTLMADYTSGREDYATAGFNYQFSERLGIMGGVLVPNEDGDTLYTVHFVYGGNYKKPSGE